MIYQMDGVFLTPMEITKIVHGTMHGESTAVIQSLTIDSRDCNDGGMFVCICGERLDGHAFIAEAKKNGAVCVITSHDADTAGLCEIRVADTEMALAALAKWYQEKIAPITVAITGSVGKTTTKQMTASVLAQRYATRSTVGNLNNLIGMPLTVLSLRQGDQAAVYEMGMNHKGEISRLSHIAQPDIAMITNIGTSHIEYLGSREGIRDAKLEICDGLKKDGILLLNGDEPLLWGIPGARYVAYDNKAADYLIEDVREENSEMRFSLKTPEGHLDDLRIAAVGMHNVIDAAFAAAVGKCLQLSDAEIRAGLLQFENTGMRQKIYDLQGVTVIEDCYNASPESMRAALDVLADRGRATSSRTVAILGDMRELGEYGEALHKDVGTYLAQKQIDVLFTFGELALDIAVGALEGGLRENSIFMFRNLENVQEIGATLKSTIHPGDMVLLKASRAVALERLLPFVGEMQNAGE